MPGRNLKIAFFLLLNTMLFSHAVRAQSDTEEKHSLVAMRMIGHEILLLSGDSTSRILPVARKGDHYEIRFETDFHFKPEELAATVDKVLVKNKVAKSYIVEVKRCLTNEVVYTYEIGGASNPDIVPCGPRDQPKDCYTICLTLLKKEEATSSSGTRSVSYAMIAFPLVSLLALIGLFIYSRKKKKPVPDFSKSSDNLEIIPIGAYRFDRKNMTLSYRDEKTELSGKEADLLFLLYSNENKTLEREIILRVVWGDEGDYIGRTLDVFISKLRKKLEADPGIKIINIRGVGYKFILN